MKEEIKKFKSVLSKLKGAEKELNKTVSLKLKDTTNIDELQGLLDTLPLEYKGRRRIIEKILKLQK